MTNWSDVINNPDFVWTKNTESVLSNADGKRTFDIASDLHSAIFDSNSDAFSDYLDFVSRAISPYSIRDVAEYGCGNGALLYWYNRACKLSVYGYDISTALIDKCRTMFDPNNFKIPDGTYYHVDWHLCNSVLQYIDSENAAKQLISDLIANSNIGVFISDIKNAETQPLFYEKQMKRQNLTKEQLEHKYKDTPLRFYRKEFFSQFGKVTYYDMPKSYPDSDLKSFAVRILLDK